jgi:conjugative transposon TraN protein
MKKLISILATILLLATSVTNAQVPERTLPGYVDIIPYQLAVGYYSTTVIVFPSPIVDADGGSSEIIIQQQENAENILKIKAAAKNFSKTNVHVYTKDGKIFAFNIEYQEYPSRTTFDLSNLTGGENPGTTVLLSSSSLSNQQLQHTADSLRTIATNYSRKKNRYGITLQLSTIHAVKNILFFGFSISNRTNLDYELDFTKLYIEDKKRAKQTSFQRQEITPAYTDPIEQIAADSSMRIVIAVPRFTIPGKKIFTIQFFEKNGGRHIQLTIKNKHLLKASKT